MNPLAIGACSGSLYLKDPAECFRRASSLGIEVIQLSGMPHSYGHLSPSEVARQASEGIADFQIPISNLTTMASRQGKGGAIDQARDKTSPQRQQGSDEFPISDFRFPI